jgi:hypothetical protein
MLRSLIAGLASLMMAAVAHAQPGVDRLSERGVSDDYEAMASKFDLAGFVAQYGVDKVTSASQLRSRLGKNDVCGRDRDGIPGVPIDTICATMIHVYQSPGGVSSLFAAPVFALEAPDPSRNAQAAVQTALVIGQRGLPGLVKFADILPKAGAAPVVNGVTGEGAYQFTVVVGRMENNKADTAKQLPPEFFDHRPYRRG